MANKKKIKNFLEGRLYKGNIARSKDVSAMIDKLQNPYRSIITNGEYIFKWGKFDIYNILN